MQYVDLNSGVSGTTVGKSNTILKLESKLESNLKSFIKYYSNKNIKFNNSHTLSRMCNSVSAYIGSSPKETYERIYDRIRFIGNLFNVVYPGVKQETQEVFLGRDVMVYKEFKVTFDSSGALTSKSSPFKLYTHNLTSLVMDYYLNVEDEFSIIGVDLPLLAATLHQSIINSERNGTNFVRDKFLTEHFTLNMVKDTINVAMLNRLSLDSTGISEDGYNSYSSSTPYMSQDLEQYYEEARPYYREYVEQLTRTSVGDLFNNLPLPFENDLVIEVNDYYLSSLMWVNAYVEVNLYNKLEELNTNYDLKLNTSSQVNRLKSLLGRNRSKSLVKGLPNDIMTQVTSVISM